MSEWKKCKLGEVIDLFGGGTPKTSVSEYWNGNIPWLSVADFNSGKKFVFNTEKYISELGLKNSSTKLLNKNDIIISARGTVGVIAMLGKQMAFNQSCYGIRAKSEFTTNDYIYYFLKDMVDSFLQISHGGVFDTITRDTFQEIDILLPPLPEQKAIVSVLSSLDNKIDLLHRQNKTLETMAETLFRQWFVEEAKEDWEEKPLLFFGKIVCGKTPSKKRQEYFNGSIPFIKIPDMHNNTFIFKTSDSLTEEGKESQNHKTLPPRSICVSCIATVGLVSMTARESQTNQQINSIIPKKSFYRYYLYLLMKNLKDLLIAMASSGTTILNLNTGCFSKIEIALPDENILRNFHNIVEPLFDKIFENQAQIRTLEQLRDTLLPKLMSGEVRVKY
ncbi:restriction endonuclease subunit S [Peptococcaceae bacterium]|nr:restriction endonuclease subunit S [Peptococcaceae bacterium]MCL0072057.1 restriction endonuclease subunit S [Peptococcaceae bacterium]MCL0106581.1 restriction endonuclease subunit S [Peptococcaceae bacterium]